MKKKIDPMTIAYSNRHHAPETARRLREGEQMRQSAEKTPDSPLPDIEKADVLRYNNAVKRLDTTRWRA